MIINKCFSLFSLSRHSPRSGLKIQNKTYSGIDPRLAHASRNLVALSLPHPRDSGLNRLYILTTVSFTPSRPRMESWIKSVLIIFPLILSAFGSEGIVRKFDYFQALSGNTNHSYSCIVIKFHNFLALSSNVNNLYS